MRYLFCAFFLLISATKLHSQRTCYDLSILDKHTQKPLANKTISVEGGLIHGLTDEQGRVNLCFDGPLDKHKPLPIEVEGVGFVYWDVESGNNTLLVDHSALKLDEVIVLGIGGTYGNVNRRSVQDEVVSARRLFQGNSSNIFQELAKLNGVRTMTQIPTSQNKIYLHGMTANRLGVVVDGVKLENQQWGDDHGIDLNQLGLEKVEIIKNAQSLLYGSGAMGGVVNFVQRDNIPNNSIWGNIYSQYATNAGLIDNHIDLAAKWQGLTIGGYADGRISHDYHNPIDGYVLGSRYKQLNFGGHLFYNKNWGFLKLKFNQYHKTLGLPDADNRDSATGKFANSPWNKSYKYQSELLGNSREDWQETSAFMSTRQRNLSLAGKYNFSPHTNLSYSVNWQENVRRELGAHDHDHNNEGEDIHAEQEADEMHAGAEIIEHLRFDLQTINYNLIFHHDVHLGAGIWTNDVALSGGMQFNKMSGFETLIPEFEQFYTGLVWVTDWKRKFSEKHVLDVSFGLRGDFTNINTFNLFVGNRLVFKALNKDYWNPSANLALEYTYADKLKFNFTVAHAFRVPQVVELLANGAHHGTDRYEIGDLNLRSERNLQFSLAGGYYNQHFYAKAEGYVNIINDFIYIRRVLNQEGRDSVSHGSRVYQYAQKTAFITGFDAELDLHPHPIDWLHFLNRFSMVYGIFAEPVVDNITNTASKNLPRMAAPQWVSELRANLKIGNKGPLRGLNINLESVYNLAQDRYFATYYTETATPAYWLLNAGLGFNFYVKDYNICNLFVFASNLLDVAYQDHLNLLKYQGNPYQQGGRTYRGIFNMGRNIGIKLHIPIQYKF